MTLYAGYRCLTLLTDYGLDDGFVAACHGVAARLAPELRVLDVTHLVPPGDIRRGGAVLAQTVEYLPPGVHVVVVDPGVGTARRPIAVSAGDSVFVGPDNGVLSWPVDVLGGPARVHELANEDLWLSPVSRTFHGRDIFTPVGARLAAGLAGLDAVGPALSPDELTWLPRPVSQLDGQHADGEVVTIDRFGNLQLSITAGQLGQLGMHAGSEAQIELPATSLTVPCGEAFAAVAPGELVLHVDSAGFAALAVNAGSAAGRLDASAGHHVRLSRSR